MKFLHLNVRLFKKREPSDGIIHPGHDWRFVLSLFALCIISTAIAHYLIFLSLNATTPPQTPSISQVSLKREELEATFERLNKQERIHQNLLEHKPTTVDPG